MLYMKDIMKEELDYILIDHTADIGIKVKATNLEGLFIKAALALIHLILGKIPEEKYDILKLEIEGEDISDLMLNWLREILYLFEGEKKIFTNAKIFSINYNRIFADIYYVPFDIKKYEVQYEIKAVTYHQLNVFKNNQYWQASIIFDV